MSNATITPSVAGVRLLTDFAPMIPPNGLALGGTTPVFAVLLTIPTLGNNVVPAVQLTGGAPILTLSMATSVGTLSLSGVASTVNVNEASLSPSAGATNFLGVAPGLGLGVNQPGSAQLLLAGAAAVVGIPNRSITPLIGTVVLSGLAPALPGQLSITSASVSFPGVAPILNLTLAFGAAQSGPLGLIGVKPGLALGIAPLAGLVRLTTPPNSPLIAASAASLSLTGAAPGLNGAFALIPPAGSLSLAGSVGLQTLTVPAPPTANLVLGGYYPALVTNYNAAPSSGSLTLPGAAPSGLQHSFVVTPQTGVSQLGVASPPSIAFLGFNLFTSLGAAGLTGVAPLLSRSTVLIPTVVALSLNGVASALVPGGSIATAAGALATAGGAPSITASSVAAPASAAIALSPSAVTLNYSVSPPSAALALVSTPATVNGRTQIFVPVGSIATAGSAPPQSLTLLVSAGTDTLLGIGASLSLGIAPSAVSLTLAGATVQLNQQGLPFPAAGTLSLTAAAPIITIGARTFAGAISLAGVAPGVNSLTTLTPSSGAAGFVSDPVSIAQLGVISPPTVLLSFASDPLETVRSGYAAPDSAALGISGNVPGVLLTSVGLCNPGSAAVTLRGQPSVLPLYDTDPYYRVALPSGLFVVTLPPSGK